MDDPLADVPHGRLHAAVQPGRACPGCRVPCGFTQRRPADRPAAPRQAVRRGARCCGSRRAYEREHDFIAPRARRSREARTAMPVSDFQPVIGLEVHAQLLTQTKIFCGCSTAFGAPPNTHTCPVCLGMPGVLPVLNQQVVEFAMRDRAGARLHASTRRSVCARKNYFYPDLPKGYQITPVRPADLRVAASSTSTRDGGEKRDPHPPHPHGGGRRQERARRRRRRRVAGRPEPRRACRCWRSSASRTCATPDEAVEYLKRCATCCLPRRQRRQHGGGLASAATPTCR